MHCCCSLLPDCLPNPQVQVQGTGEAALLLDTTTEVTALLKQAHANGTATGKPTATGMAAVPGITRPADMGGWWTP
jgi:hypothetical protein